MSLLRTIAAAQVPGAPAGDRLALAEAAMHRARGAALVAFPEACFPGYAPGRAADADRAEAWLRDAARRSGAVLCAGVASARASRLCVVTPDGRIRRYTKRFPTFAEAPHWAPGDGADQVVETPIGRVGLLLCSDLMQIAAWRTLARAAVDLVVVSAAWTDYGGRVEALGPLARAALGPWMRGAAPARDAVLARGARALGVPVVYANACGPWRLGERFDGGSRVLDATGRVIAAIGGAPGVARAEVDLGVRTAAGRRVVPAAWRAFGAVHRVAAGAVRSLEITR